jgi:hypothetical protein
MPGTPAFGRRPHRLDRRSAPLPPGSVVASATVRSAHLVRDQDDLGSVHGSSRHCALNASPRSGATVSASLRPAVPHHDRPRVPSLPDRRPIARTARGRGDSRLGGLTCTPRRRGRTGSTGGLLAQPGRRAGHAPGRRGLGGLHVGDRRWLSGSGRGGHESRSREGGGYGRLSTAVVGPAGRACASSDRWIGLCCPRVAGRPATGRTAAGRRRRRVRWRRGRYAWPHSSISDKGGRWAGRREHR